MLTGIAIKHPICLNITDKSRWEILKPVLLSIYFCINAPRHYGFLAAETARFLVRLLPYFGTENELVPLLQIAQFFLLFNFRKPFREFACRYEEDKLIIEQLLAQHFGFQLGAIEDSDDDQLDNKEETCSDGSDDEEEGESKGTQPSGARSDHSQRLGGPNKMSKADYLEQLRTLREKTRPVEDEYANLNSFVEQISETFLAGLPPSVSSGLRRGVRELQSIGYRRIGDRNVVRKYISIKRK
jgi:hypothetical protein